MAIILEKYQSYESLANDPQTPVKVLRELSTHHDSYVRFLVAGNPSTPSSVLVKLSNDQDWKVRYNVGENLNTPVEVVRKIYAGDIKKNIKEVVQDSYHEYKV